LARLSGGALAGGAVRSVAGAAMEHCCFLPCDKMKRSSVERLCQDKYMFVAT
jgi:hypothetical protein